MVWFGLVTSGGSGNAREGQPPPVEPHTWQCSVGVCPANLVGYRANPCLWPATPNAVKGKGVAVRNPCFRKQSVPNPCSRKQSVTILAPVFSAGSETGRIPALRRASDRYLTPPAGASKGRQGRGAPIPSSPPPRFPAGKGNAHPLRCCISLSHGSGAGSPVPGGASYRVGKPRQEIPT